MNNFKYKAFYSDPHFGHLNIIKYANRPYSSINEMNEDFICKYNTLVEKNDTVLWLGDCFFVKPIAAAAILNQMNGEKHLILGNHDKFTERKYERIGFSKVVRGFIFDKVNGVKICFSHYPYASADSKDLRYLERRPTKNDFVLIHGHTHQSNKIFNDSIHVGVDSWNMGPARIEYVVPLIHQIHESLKGKKNG